MTTEELDYIILRINRAVDELCLVMNIVSGRDVPPGRENVEIKIMRALDAAIKVGDCLESYKEKLEEDIHVNN